MQQELPLSLRLTYEAGTNLREAIQTHLASWPVGQRNFSVSYEDAPDDVRRTADDLVDRAATWFNRVTVNVLPYTAFDRVQLALLLRRVVAAVKCKRFYQEYRVQKRQPQSVTFMFPIDNSPEFNVEHGTSREAALTDALEAMDEALRLVRTAVVVPAQPIPAGHPTARHVSNTAFILMWMDKGHPELVDVHQTVKETFAAFGVNAVRADEIQHQDKITDLILERIVTSEFLFADLTGERPNVYYEIGYAHALGKRPILYRRAGTPLHFDLSVHNVPEYQNVTELRSQLRERLKAITGRGPVVNGREHS